MSEQALSSVETYDDGRFVRTAVVVPPEGASFDLVDEHGTRLAVVNCFVYYVGDDLQNGEVRQVITDIIDIDQQFNEKRAMTFDQDKRQFLPTKHLVCAHFEKVEK